MDKLEKIDQKLEKISDHLSSIDVTLAKQEISLEEHIRRTSLNEQAIEHIKQVLIPVNKHITSIETGLKLIGATSTIVMLLVGLFKISEYL